MIEETGYNYGKEAYQAYGNYVDFKNFQGNPMPSWNDLGEKIQGAWQAAALKVWKLALDGLELKWDDSTLIEVHFDTEDE